jgi:hypothetical protein
MLLDPACVPAYANSDLVQNILLHALGSEYEDFIIISSQQKIRSTTWGATAVPFAYID